MSIETILTVLFFGLGLLLPWGLALAKRLRLPDEDSAGGTVPRTAMAHSLLAYVIAFNVTFFIQELFLVLPKAFVPGLDPVLYHNNHNWTGDAAIADLFQGTGALAILVSGLIFLALAKRQERPSFLVVWMAFHGLFQSLPQFVVGAITAGNDVGQAYDYLELGIVGETLLALIALAALPVAGVAVGRRFLAAAWDERQVRSARGRFGYLLRVAALPALISVPIVILYRVPREAIEVLAGPILVPLFGYAWLQHAAFHPAATVKAGGSPPEQVARLAVVAVILLAIFQLVLRPGIPF